MAAIRWRLGSFLFGFHYVEIKEGCGIYCVDPAEYGAGFGITTYDGNTYRLDSHDRTLSGGGPLDGRGYRWLYSHGLYYCSCIKVVSLIIAMGYGGYLLWK